MKQTLLIVDDDATFRDRLGRALARRGLEVTTAGSVREALETIVRSSPFDFAVLDLKMPDGSGLELIDPLRRRSPATRIVVLTGYGSIATAVQAVKQGAAEYLQKPIDADQIMATLRGDVGETDSAAAPSLARVEWEHIQRVLTDCGGNVSEAARRLGIHRRSLQRKLQRTPPGD